MPYTFKRHYNPIANCDVLDIFDENGRHGVQATACRDVPGSVLAGFSGDNGHTWYGHHKTSASTLDEFQRRFED